MSVRPYVAGSRGLTFHDAALRFEEGTDSPSDYLKRCLDTVSAREPEVQAFAHLNIEGAIEAAAASTKRWCDGKPLSPIDGMPIGIKDLLETKDMPTEHGCEAYRGHFPKRDNAAVWALRQAGAVIVGKTVTAELGGSHPGPTINPYDPDRTPGGSSSGSAAAVAVDMLPAAIGTQVGGSIIRPSSYCGNRALKPTQGAINRGERQATSQSTHGVHANSFEDMWQVAIEIAKRVGGDRGSVGLLGPNDSPEAQKPRSLVLLETEGWADVDKNSIDALHDLCDQCKSHGIAVITRKDEPSVEMLEQALVGARSYGGRITVWENRWAQRNLLNEHPEGLSFRAIRGIELAESMSVADYRSCLESRALAQRAHERIAPLADAIVTLSSPGPAPIWLGDKEGEKPNPAPTGDFVFNAPASILFAPAVSIPLMSVGGLPLGLQLIGQQHEDARMTAIARWLDNHLNPAIR